MSEFKGTKGKWYLQEYTDAYTNIIRVKTDTHDGIYLGSSSQNPNPEYRANAKLIACAPEMLEMLNKINDFIDKNRYKNYMVELLRREVSGIEQLIKKATS